VNALVEAGLAPERIAVPSLDQAYEFSYRDGRWIAALSNAEAAPRLSVEEVTATRDWHNEYAQTLLDLRSALNRATDNRVRRRLLREVRRVIDEAHQRCRTVLNAHRDKLEVLANRLIEVETVEGDELQHHQGKAEDEDAAVVSGRGHEQADQSEQAGQNSHDPV